MGVSSQPRKRLSKRQRRELRQRQTRKSRKVRRQIQHQVGLLPDSVRSLARRTTSSTSAATKLRRKSWRRCCGCCVEVVRGSGHWYKAGQGLVEVCWVYVHDRSGTHRDEYFFSTDVRMTAQTILET